MTQKYIFQNTGKLSIGNINPNYNITFHKDGDHVGVLDFNGPEMTFTGDVNESAKLFFDLIAASFKGRLEQERADEREACAKVVLSIANADAGNPYKQALRMGAEAIRARNNT